MEMTKRLFRSNDRMLGGVCAGIAEYLDWDPTLIRIGYLILSVISAAFPGILIYILLWIIIPPRY
ncbi:PspC domain-containing protein [Ekhidna sp.]|uniref:PspC domain-containing protein n=1 Tax=Ekhidna sp. TaxID=2608089 RepID=UPI003B5085A3